ncbi:MAG: 30S ribosomal protein S24e [Candidatus Diapherotrites archaeon]|nr:30S ribosomal protein S24e [Candidatus Diapherotrites archaeon]
MEVKIIEKKRNELMKRNEVLAEVKEKTIPSRQQIRDKLSALVGAPADAIIVKKIATNFGSPRAKIFANIYDTADEMKKTEVKYLRERNFGKEKKAESVAGPEAPPANFKK